MELDSGVDGQMIRGLGNGERRLLLASVVLPCEQREQRCATYAVPPGSGRLGRRAANNSRGSGLAWKQRAWARGCSMGRGTDGEFVAGFLTCLCCCVDECNSSVLSLNQILIMTDPQEMIVHQQHHQTKEGLIT